MATNNNLPKHIAVGGYIRIAEWVGRIIDIAYSEQSRVLVLVDSPKVHFRGIKPEWLEFHFDQPDMIRQATKEEYLAEIALYSKRTERNLDEMNWLRRQTEQEEVPIPT